MTHFKTSSPGHNDSNVQYEKLGLYIHTVGIVSINIFRRIGGGFFFFRKFAQIQKADLQSNKDPFVK